mmetsp:Transcript_13445/g.38053  ORF Transcript_13445/g.38053 Transcript_13445/m.38053 type:complete len:221 (-) Transcript_13445:474-1136(-)
MAAALAPCAGCAAGSTWLAWTRSSAPCSRPPIGGGAQSRPRRPRSRPRRRGPSAWWAPTGCPCGPGRGSAAAWRSCRPRRTATARCPSTPGTSCPRGGRPGALRRPATARRVAHLRGVWDPPAARGSLLRRSRTGRLLMAMMIRRPRACSTTSHRRRVPPTACRGLEARPHGAPDPAWARAGQLPERMRRPARAPRGGRRPGGGRRASTGRRPACRRTSP